jgi:hypothetical protein
MKLSKLLAGSAILAFALVPRASAQSIESYIVAATAAESAGDFLRAGQALRSAYPISGQEVGLLYAAAVDFARAGRRDDALALVGAAVDSGFSEISHLLADTNFRAVQHDPRWAAIVRRAQARRAAMDTSLRAELLDLARRDQENRSGIMAVIQKEGLKSPRGDSALKAMTANDKPIQARLKAIVDARGWPTRRLVGDDGSHAAWLIAQHSPDLAFQKSVLASLSAAAKKGDARLGDVAYLDDRVRMNEGRPQLYGTQLKGTDSGGSELVPIEDEANVEARRAHAGLGPLAEYLKQFGVDWKPPAAVKTPPNGQPPERD